MIFLSIYLALTTSIFSITLSEINFPFVLPLNHITVGDTSQIPGAYVNDLKLELETCGLTAYGSACLDSKFVNIDSRTPIFTNRTLYSRIAPRDNSFALLYEATLVRNAKNQSVPISVTIYFSNKTLSLADAIANKGVIVLKTNTIHSLQTALTTQALVQPSFRHDYHLWRFILDNDISKTYNGPVLNTIKINLNNPNNTVHQINSHLVQEYHYAFLYLIWTYFPAETTFIKDVAEKLIQLPEDEPAQLAGVILALRNIQHADATKRVQEALAHKDVELNEYAVLALEKLGATADLTSQKNSIIRLAASTKSLLTPNSNDVSRAAINRAKNLNVDEQNIDTLATLFDTNNDDAKALAVELLAKISPAGMPSVVPPTTTPPSKKKQGQATPPPPAPAVVPNRAVTVLCQNLGKITRDDTFTAAVAAIASKQPSEAEQLTALHTYVVNHNNFKLAEESLKLIALINSGPTKDLANQYFIDGFLLSIHVPQTPVEKRPAFIQYLKDELTKRVNDLTDAHEQQLRRIIATDGFPQDLKLAVLSFFKIQKAPAPAAPAQKQKPKAKK